MSDSQKKLSFRTSDGILYEIALEVAMQMGIIRTMTECEENGNQKETDEHTIIPLPKVNSDIFDMVIRWMQAIHQMSEDQKQVPDDSVELDLILNNTLPQLDASGKIFELIAAADFLDIEDLLEACTQRVADQIAACLTVEKLRLRFNLQNDFEEPEEEEEGEWW